MLPGGSSPLTRGKQLVGRDVGPVVRLIPAHAGKTAERSSELGGRVGSSPLTRGKLGRVDADRPAGGLIPAHAGKTP